MHRLLFSLLGLFLASATIAEDHAPIANTVFANAIKIYSESQSQDEAAQKTAAIEILRLFELIVTAYPDSIPGRRIASGERVGPIDLPRLRALAGVDVQAIETASEPEEMTSETPMDASDPVEWFQRVLHSGTPEGGFAHGSYPSVGQRTHPGIDLISACGQNVTAPWDATIERVIKAGDADFPSIGNAVILRHSGRWNPPVYSTYFFLGSTPEVREGDLAKGEIIGQTGPLHTPSTCGVHFELRNFGTEQGPIHTLWHNVLGVGDWTMDAEFTDNWRDPKAWLTRLNQIENGVNIEPLLLAQNDWVSVYQPGLAGHFNNGKRYFLRSPGDQDLTFNSGLHVRRVFGGVSIRTRILTRRFNRQATQSVVQPADRLAFSLRVSLYNSDNPSEPVLENILPTAERFSNGQFRGSDDSIELFLPTEDLIKGDFIRLELVARDGRSFLLGQDINLLPDEAAKPAHSTSALKEYAQMLIELVESCPAIEVPSEQFEAFAVQVGPEREYKRGRVFVEVPNSSTSQAEIGAILTALSSATALDRCLKRNTVAPMGLRLDWVNFDLVLGRSEL